MRLIKRFSAISIVLMIITLNGQLSFGAQDIYKMLLQANKKTSDYREVVTSSFDAGGGDMSNMGIYRYYKKFDLTMVEQNMAMSNRKTIIAIANTSDIKKKQVYIYNPQSKKYEKAANSNRYGINRINTGKFIDLSDESLKIITSNSKVTNGKGSITIKSNLTKSQINKIAKNNQTAYDSWGNSRMNNGTVDTYDTLKYTIVLKNGKISNITIAKGRKDSVNSNSQNSSNGRPGLNSTTTYAVSYEPQQSIAGDFNANKSSKTYSDSYNSQGWTNWNHGNNGMERQNWPDGSNNGNSQNGHSSFGWGWSQSDMQSGDSTFVLDAKIILSLCAFFILLALVYNYMIRNTVHNLTNILQNKWTYIGTMVIIFIVRIIVAYRSTGFVSDIRLFQEWATSAANNGLADFYTQTRSVDYPPGYIFILYGIGKLYNIFNLGTDAQAAIVLIKLPAILADMAITVIVFMTARNRIKDMGAFGLSIVFALNPAAILDSTIWGQVDSVFALAILSAVLLLSKKRMRLASAVFVAAVLIKPQALIFSPVFIWAFIKERSIKEFFLSALSGIVTFVILLLPFSIKQNPTWIIDLYKNTLGSYPYASVNAFNLFAFFGGNFSQDTATFFIFSYKQWSMFFIIAIVAYSGYMFLKHKGENGDEDRARYFYVSMFIIVAVFTITSKMHERYLYPSIVFAIMSYIYSKNIKILHIYAATTATIFINVFVVYEGGMMAQITNSNLWLISTAICNFVILISIVVVDLVKKTTKN